MYSLIWGKGVVGYGVGGREIDGFATPICLIFFWKQTSGTSGTLFQVLRSHLTTFLRVEAGSLALLFK